MSRPDATVVTYHYVRNAERSEFPRLRACPVSAFEAQVEFLTSRFAVVDYPTFEALVGGGRGPGGPVALLTFDDGFVDHYETVLPILRRHGVSGLFFVIGATLRDPPRLPNVHRIHFLLAHLGAKRFAAEVRRELAALDGASPLDLSVREGIYRYDSDEDRRLKRWLNYEVPMEVAEAILGTLFERHIGALEAFARRLYLTPTMIREMTDAGMAFGWHTERHPVLSRLDASGQRGELAAGVGVVKALTGQTSVPFCYPYGHAHTFDGETLRLLAELRYAMAFTVEQAPVPLGPPARDPYTLPRIDCTAVPPLGSAWGRPVGAR